MCLSANTECNVTHGTTLGSIHEIGNNKNGWIGFDDEFIENNFE